MAASPMHPPTFARPMQLSGGVGEATKAEVTMAACLVPMENPEAEAALSLVAAAARQAEGGAGWREGRGEGAAGGGR